jgi:hypothetical protein
MCFSMRSTRWRDESRSSGRLARPVAYVGLTAHGAHPILVLFLRLVLLASAVENGLHHLLVLRVTFTRIGESTVLLRRRHRQRCGRIAT